jgi:uncharacterized membrane protein
LRFATPKMNPTAAARLVYLSALALALAWVGGIVAAPFLHPQAAGAPHKLTAATGGEVSLASLFYYAYGTVCHQVSDRSFHVDGRPLAVCARCFGIYAGYLVGLTAYPLARRLDRTDTPRRAWLALALVPVAVDLIGGVIGAFENTHASRFATGALAGAAAAFYTLPGLVAVVTERGKESRKKWREESD